MAADVEPIHCKCEDGRDKECPIIRIVWIRAAYGYLPFLSSDSEKLIHLMIHMLNVWVTKFKTKASCPQRK